MENNQLQQRLAGSAAGILDWAETAATDGDKLIREQAPILVQEYLNWSFYQSAIAAGACLIAVVALSALLGYVLLRRAERRDCGGLGLTGMLSGLVAAVFAVGLIENTLHCLKVMMAPRLVVVQFFSDLL